MEYSRSSSFDRTYRKLEASDRAKVEQAIVLLVHALDSGQGPKGLGLKKLKRDFWEIRAGISIRILFKLEAGLVTFVIVGTHDEIRRYLRNL